LAHVLPCHYFKSAFSCLESLSESFMFSDASVQQFRASLRGQLILPGDLAYDEARKIHNAMIDKKPALIVRCAGAADVIACIEFARKSSVTVSVRAGGHNVAGTSLCDGLVIDLTSMKSVDVNPAARTVRVGGGATWQDVNHELQVFGLAAAGGYVGTTGVGGLTLGGGLGWMVRKHGLALDNLRSADIVTADGRLLTASAEQNADLFWAIRGGGGNFGVVTSFEFKVHQAGTVLAGMVLHPAIIGAELLRFWRDYERTAPEEISNGAVFFTPPPELPVPDAIRARPTIGVGGVYLGSLEAAERDLRSLREFGSPAADLFQPMPYSAAQSMADFVWPRGLHGYWKSSFMNAFSDAAIDTILSHYAKAPSRHTVIVLEHDGDGAMDRVPAEATAFGHRNFTYNLVVTTQWEAPSETHANIEWTKEFWAALKPFLANASYVNYIDDEGEEGVRMSYGAKLHRLAALKTKYDPTNFFHVNQNIKPLAATSTSA
jgi:FAD/FMN-containing dehydrogenase